MKETLVVVIAYLAGAGVAALAHRLRVPGSLILGGLIGSAAVTLMSDTRVAMPSIPRSAIYVGIGTLIGITVTREAVANLRHVLLPALLAGGLLIISGMAIAFLLRWLGLAPTADVLATSPGALSVLVGTASELHLDALEVATFHLVRVLLVIWSLPVLIRLLVD